MNPVQKYKTVLTIAGSDPSGGAGIQADLKTFSALGCYGMSAITSLTAQNTQGVQGVHNVPSDFVFDQIKSIAKDINLDAIKIGMLHNSKTIKTVAAAIKEFKLKNIVLDPVIYAKGGDKLLEDDAVDSLKNELFPLARIITPNLREANHLVKFKFQQLDQIEKAASELCIHYNTAVVIKGIGHENQKSDDCLSIPSENSLNEIIWLNHNRVNTLNVHGAGCTFSSSIAAFLAQNKNLKDAVFLAKEFTTKAIISGMNFKLGQGHGPVKHFYQFWKN